MLFIFNSPTFAFNPSLWLHLGQDLARAHGAHCFLSTSSAWARYWDLVGTDVEMVSLNLGLWAVECVVWREGEDTCRHTCEMCQSRFSAEVGFATLVNLENHRKLARCLGLATEAMVPRLLPRVTVIAQCSVCSWAAAEGTKQPERNTVPTRDKSGELCFTFLRPPLRATATQSVV